MDAPPGGAREDTSPAAVRRYAVAVGITVLAIVSQYFVPEIVPASRPVYASTAADLLIVYAIPVVAFSLLVGAGPLRRWRVRMGTAAWEGMRWYGGLSLLALFVTLVLTSLYAAFDPAALQLLSRTPPPVLAARSDPWFWVGFSFVIGAVEETIFRGWIYGFWRGRAASWLVPAVWTSVLFAGVHLYYGTTYGVAAPLIFPTLFLIGFAFAATYQASSGNLVVVAVLHGAYDASAFLSLISPSEGAVARYLPVLAGAVIALVHYLDPSSGSPALPAAAPSEPS